MATSLQRVSVGVGIASVVVLYFFVPWIIYPILILLFALLGVVLATLRGGYQRRRADVHYGSPQQQKNHSVLFRTRVYPPVTIRPTLISVGVDSCIQDVINLILEHHVAPLYEMVASKQDAFLESLRSEVWSVLHVLLKRVSQIDTLKLFSADTVETLRKHFVYSRELKPPPSHSQGSGAHKKRHPFPDMKKFPYLETPEKELEFLRKAVEVLLCVCLPREYLLCTPVRALIREYLVCHIVQPTVDRLCEPDYINQKLLAYLTKREEETKSTATRYSYSETYEDFIKHIQKCEDVNQLTQIRHSIITDIMQAKAVQHMKDASSTGLRVANLSISISADKAKSLMDRDLKLYITQLTTAKIVSDRRIRNLGGEVYQHDKLVESSEVSRPDFPRPIPFDTIMLNEMAMMYFLHYLEHAGFGNLLSYWKEVQNLAIVPSSEIDNAVKHIHTQYLAQGAEYSIYPDPKLLDEVEKTISSDCPACIEAMSKIQEEIFEYLKDCHYEGFLHSEAFKVFMEGEAEQEELTTTSFIRPASMSVRGLSDEESSYKTRLRNLKKKLQERDSTLAYLPMTRSDSSTTLKRLEKGRFELQEEIKQLERYIEHTDEWFGTIGQWNVEVTSVDLAQDEGNDKDPLILVVVHRPEMVVEQIESVNPDHSFFPISPKKPGVPSIATSSETSSEIEEEDGFVSISDPDDNVPKSAGWVIGRHFSEFEELHKNISQVCPKVQFPPNPTRLFSVFQKKEVFEKRYWEKYRQALQSYLNSVVHDPKLQESEVVFNFLSPASADLSQSGIFKDTRQIKLSTRETKADEHILDHVSSLISEVFDLQERSRVLRRQLYELVQLTFGRSIEGEMQDFMKWVVSEPMLVYYIETFREAMWPGRVPAPPPPVRSDEDKEATQEAAKQRFLKSAPQTLQTILGQRNCQIGLLKMFNTFQDPHANKQLFYSYFELLLYALVPELESVEVDPSNIT